MPDISLPEIHLPDVKLPEGLRDMNRHDIQNAIGDARDSARDRMPRRIEMPDGSWYWDLKPDWRPGEVVDL